MRPMECDQSGVTSPENERRAAFTAVYATCYRDVVAYALRRCRDSTAAAEIAAATFAVVWRRLDEVPGGDETRPWVFGVARKVLANDARSHRRRDRLAAHVAAAVASMPAVIDGVDDGRVDAALDRLTPTDAEPLRLSYWEGLGPTELSIVLGVGASTVRSQLTRARQRFRVEYEAISVPPRSDRRDAGHVPHDEHLLVQDLEERNP